MLQPPWHRPSIDIGRQGPYYLPVDIEQPYARLSKLRLDFSEKTTSNSEMERAEKLCSDRHELDGNTVANDDKDELVGQTCWFE